MWVRRVAVYVHRTPMDPSRAPPFFLPFAKKNKKKQTRKSADKSQMGGLDEYMIGGVVRAYPQPSLAMTILLKYVGLEGECPSAPRPRSFFFAPLPFRGRVRFIG